MPSRPLRFALFMLAPLTLTLACGRDDHDSRDYDTVESQAASALRPARGVTSRWRVNHYLVDYPEDCDTGCGGACGPSNVPIDSRITSLTAPAECTVEANRVGVGAFDVDVTCDAVGTFPVRLVLEDPEGGRREEGFSVTFEEARELRVTHPRMDSPWTGVYASLPGATREACVEVVGTSGMSLDPGDGLRLTGDDLVVERGTLPDRDFDHDPARCDRLTAETAGRHEARYTFGALVARVPIHVVAPSDVTKLSLHRIEERTGEVKSDYDILAGAPAETSFEVSCVSNETFALRFETADGTAGLASTEGMLVEPMILARVVPRYDGRRGTPIASLVPMRSGSGRIRAEVGSVTELTPLTVDRCITDPEPFDAGADASDGATEGGADGG